MSDNIISTDVLAPIIGLFGVVLIATGISQLLQPTPPEEPPIPEPPVPPSPIPNLATLYGVIYDSVNLTPIEGVLITLNSESTQSTHEGFYELANITPGVYTLTLEKEGYETVATDINLPEGITRLDASMVAIPEEPVFAHLYGYVTDSITLLALSGVMVELFSSDGTKLITYTTTDTNGYYSIENILPGNYILYFKKEGYETITV